MCCHKKCIAKCQTSTICGPVDATAAMQQSGMSMVEFKVTDADADGEVDDFEEIDEAKPSKLDQHRQSFSGFISQGIKRVNSANNLAIPSIVSSLNQGSRSLPPSPQHTPRYEFHFGTFGSALQRKFGGFASNENIAYPGWFFF